MSIEAEKNGLPPPMEKPYPESATSELQPQVPQDATTDKVNGSTCTLTPETPVPDAAIQKLAVTSHSVHIPRLSFATADLVARANGNSGQPESPVNASQAATEDTARSLPQLGQAAVIEGSLNTAQANTNHTSSPAAAAVHSPNPDDIKSTSPQIFPSERLLLSEQQSNMAADSNKTVVSPNGAKSPGTPKKTTTSPSTIIPASANSASKAAAPKRKAATTPRGSGSKRPKKRKSGKHDGDDGVIKAGDSTSDESDEPAPTTTQTKSGRQINRPLAFAPPSPEAPAAPSPADQASQPPRKRRRLYRKGRENNITCLRCQRAHSAPSNAIVFCDDCNGAWHQFCHDPPIGNQVITVKETQWFCSECRPVEGDPATRPVDQRPGPVNSGTEKISLASEVLVGGSKFSPEQRRSYLAGLSHAALVKLLVDVSSSQLELPLFPENLAELRSFTLPAPPLRARKTSKATILLSGLESTTTAPAPAPAMASISHPPPQQIVPNGTAPPLVKQTIKVNPEPQMIADPTDEDDTDEYLEHRLYPNAGNGFRLPPVSHDLDMLLEDPACTTFSHSLHGPAKARAETIRVQSVGGVA